MQEQTDKAARMAKRQAEREIQAREKRIMKRKINELCDMVIHDYIRARVAGKGIPIVGVIVGTVIKGQIVTGWSQTNLKAGDKYDKIYGLKLALDRARGIVETPALPIQLKRHMEQFKIRCLRYFKQADTLSTKGAYIAPVAKSSDVDDLINDLFGSDLAPLFKSWTKAMVGAGMIVG